MTWRIVGSSLASVTILTCDRPHDEHDQLFQNVHGIPKGTNITNPYKSLLLNMYIYRHTIIYIQYIYIIYIKHSADIMVDVGDVFYTTMTDPRWAIQWPGSLRVEIFHNCDTSSVATKKCKQYGTLW